MGQLRARTIDEWYLTGITPDEIYNYLYQDGTRQTTVAVKIQIGLQRKFSGLLAFSESLGEVRGSFQVKTAADVTMTYASTKKKFRCIRDEITVSDTIDGEGMQVQTWLYIGDDQVMPAGHLDAPT